MAQRARERVQIKPSSPRGLQVTTALAFFITLNLAVQAQDALRTALRGDDAYRERIAEEFVPPDDALRAGPVLFQAAASYGLEWNDNLFLTPNDPEDDLIHRPQVNLTAIWPVTETSQLSLGLGIGYQAYMDHSELNGLTLAPLSALAWDFRVEDFIFTVSDQFSYSQDASSQGTISSGTDQFPRFENTVGLRVRWNPSRYVFELGYAHYNFISVSGSATNFDYLDRTAEQFFGRAAIRIAEASMAGLEISSSLTDYRSFQQSDNVSVSVGPFIDWQVTHALNLNLHGGLVNYTYDPSLLQPVSQDLNTYYAGLRARHQLTDHINHEFLITQGVEQALNVGSDYIESFRCSYRVSWAFHRSASLSFDASYEQSDEPQLGVSSTYDVYGAGLGIGLQPMDHLGVNLAYHYTTRTSDVAGQDYDQNMVTLAVSYQF